jgi:hypothetical protein
MERRYPHLIEDNVMQAQEREERVEKEVKQRETRRVTQNYLRKLGYQIRGHVKPNSTKKSSLNRFDVQMEEGLWRQIVGKTQVEEHLIERNVEQLSHAGATPLGYNDLGTTTGSTNDDSELEPVYHDISDLTSSEETLIAKIKEIIHFFIYLVQVTGGDLAPEKCVWYLISHRWKDGKPRLLQKKQPSRD